MHITKKQILFLLLSLFAAVLAHSASQPNVVIIFNDDQGYQDLGCFGSPDIKTPRVDQMAKDGMRFTDFYVASPVCSSSRAALLTGCYPQRVGVKGVFWPNSAGGLDPKYVTVAETLSRAGYATAAVGKWHLGDEPQYLPTNQGFDSYYGIPYSNDMYPSSDMRYAEDCLFLEGQSPESLTAGFAGKLRRGNPISFKNKVPLMRNDECVEFPADQTTITRRYADEGLRFISESVEAQKPFFLYLANSMPHTPLFASPEFSGKSERGLYGDVIEEIDFNTGRILDHLKALGIEDDTIVIFSSDNGPWLIKGDHGGSALPLFEGKMTTFEGGQRVPCIIKWPARIPAGSVCSELATMMDVLPTLAHIVDAPLSALNPLDGKNIIDLLTAKPGATTPHAYFFYGRAAVRSGDWKYHAKERFIVKATQRDSTGPTLYNLKDDIGESINLINEHPEIAERLRLALVAHNSPAKEEVVDPRSFDLRLPDSLQQTADSEARLDQWFRDAKFGAFIHFGLYSPLAGKYDGKVSQHRYSEWIYMSESIPAEDYRQLATIFNPEAFDADEWARVFKSAGMRYVVITSKHHDGFALFKSLVSPYNVVDATPFKRDIIKELSEACHRHGLKFGVYYSHAQDWDEPNSAFDTRFHQSDIHAELSEDFKPDMDRYLNEKSLPQIEELVKNYELDLIWFDTPHGMTRERAQRFQQIIRKHRPNCLINSRLIKSGIGQFTQEDLDLFDYVSIGDKEVPDQKLPVYFESPDSVGSSYGYKAHGKYFYHTAKELIDGMVHTVCSGGNYLLNNGPMGNGRLDPEAVRLYGIIGEWIRVNGDSLIGTRANPFAAAPQWGDVSVSPDGRILYVHILNWPASGEVSLEGVTHQVTEALYLANGRLVDFEQGGGVLRFRLPEEPLDDYDTVIKLRLE